MSSLPDKIEISLWDSDGRMLSFNRTEEVIDWSESQAKAWNTTGRPNVPQLKNAWDQQLSSIGQVSSFANTLENLLKSETAAHQTQKIDQTFVHLKNALNQFATGLALSTDHRNFKYIAYLIERDQDTAAALLVASRSNGVQQSQTINVPWAVPVKLAVEIDEVDNNKSSETHRSELSSVKNAFDGVLSELRTTLEEANKGSAAIKKDRENEKDSYGQTFSELVTDCKKQWDNLVEVYDQRLGLLAPTEYWTKRAVQYRRQAWLFAIAFGAVLVVALILFGYFGLTQLGRSDSKSVTLTILPVIIPLFAGVWVLRIIGRQLSESLMIMKDAQERETLVKTFLALMRDETTGKSVVKDEDRVLILEALFRQSRVTSTDDSPPLSSLETLLGKR